MNILFSLLLLKIRLLYMLCFGVVLFFLQRKEAARPKQEIIEQEEEIVHEDNDWGK